MGREFVARKSSVWGKKSDTKPSLFTSRPFAVQTREQNTVNKKELPSEIPPANYITDKMGFNAPQPTVQRQEDDSEIKEQEPDLMSKSDESPVADEEEKISPQLEQQNQEEEKISPQLEQQNQEEETVSPQLEEQNQDEETVSPQLEEQNKDEETVSPQLEEQNQEENLDKKSIQTKLSVGEPGDKYEQEADTVAAKVVEHINSPKSQQPVQGKVEPVVQPTLMRQGGAGGGTVNRDVEQNIQQARGGGQGLADNVRQPMEQAFGADFSGVKVHTDGQADVLNRSLNSRAFATGQDIFFKQGEYNPGSKQGQELLAHELTHVVQQSSGNTESNQKINTQRGEQDSSDSQALEERLDRIEQNYREMIRKARDDGYNVAADNLERFLEGVGGTKKIKVSWLRTFSAVTNAEETNQSRFENSLTDIALELTDGESRSFSDYWDRQFTASRTTELYYASGTSTIRSKGQFQLERNGNVINISGNVDHHWYDPYDWHAGLSAYIPGFGNVSDEDALLLKRHRGAKEFDMEADWQQSVEGTVTVRNWWFDSNKYSWTGP